MKKAIVAAVIVGLCLAGLPAREVLAQAVPMPPVPAPAPAPGPWTAPPQVQVPGGPVDTSRGASVVLSVVMPGTGEWLNRGFEGPFPTAECLIGWICCFFQLSSALDAAAGDRSEKVRFDFWSKPVAER